MSTSTSTPDTPDTPKRPDTPGKSPSPAGDCPHIKLMAPDTFQQGAPLEQYRELRQSKSVCWQYDPYTKGGYWAVTRQEDLDTVSKNPSIFSSAAQTPFIHETDPEERIATQENMMICMDPPRHLKYRRIVRNAFTPAAVDSYQERFAPIAQEIVDKACAGGTCEFVADIACELPLIAICEILGVPAKDRATFFKWSNTLIGADDPEYCYSREDQMNAAASLFFYADTIMEQQRNNPSDDIVGTLLRGQVDGESLNEDEFRNFMMLLIVAGNETTRNQTSHMMRLLIEHPEQYQMIVDKPELIEPTILESIRYNSPVIAFRRTAMEDTELSGRQIKKDDKVILYYQAASHDESNFERPEVFDITRPQREPVAEKLRAFGIGEHFCLGTHLAKLQLKLVLQAITRRIRKPQFVEPPRWLYSNFINGIKEMKIKFDTVQ